MPASARPGLTSCGGSSRSIRGDTLAVETQIVEVRPSRSKPDLGSFRSDVTVFNQHDEPVMRMTSIVLIQRRPE
jgi:acyl dehydratase